MEAIEAYIDIQLPDFHKANVRQLYTTFRHRDTVPYLVAFEFEAAHKGWLFGVEKHYLNTD